MPDRDKMESLEPEVFDALAAAVVKKRARELEREILHHDHQYWVLNDPEISDPAYDALCQELRGINPESSVLHQVHAPLVSKGATIERDKPMLSLDKAYTIAEVVAWAQGVARGPGEMFRIAPKYDGVACEIDGDILATSGDDGITGEDISDKLVIVDLQMLEGETQGYGELAVLKSDWVNLRRSNGEPYKTPRAAAVGLLGADDTNRRIGRVIKFLPHSTQLMAYCLADLCGDAVPWDLLITTVQQEDYPADGLVVALMDTEYGETLGTTEHHPRHSIALKFKNPSANTKLLGIEWQCGKFKLTPVAILEPVVISGCTHDRASLHNYAALRTPGLALGATVKVERCGDVIPQLAEVVKPGNLDIDLPTVCPACGEALVYEHIDVRCVNPKCGGTAAKLLLDALNRLGIEDIGPGIASALVAKGITNAARAFECSIEDWEALDGFARPSATKMFNQFQARRLTPIEDYRILAAMNAQGVGLTMCKKICAKYALNEVQNANLQELDTIGPGREDAIKQGFDYAWFIWAISNMNVITTKGLADRPTVCFTGASETPRSEWVKIADAKGYGYKGAVTKSLTLLVCADKESKSTKMKKAQKYGINIITYSEFKEV